MKIMLPFIKIVQALIVCFHVYKKRRLKIKTFSLSPRDAKVYVINVRLFSPNTQLWLPRSMLAKTNRRTDIAEKHNFLVKPPASYGMERPTRVNAFWGQSETDRTSARKRTHLRTGVWRNRPETAGPAALVHPNPPPPPGVPAESPPPAPSVSDPADPPSHGGQRQRSRLRGLRGNRRADPKLPQTSVRVHFCGSADRRGRERYLSSLLLCIWNV